MSIELISRNAAGQSGDAASDSPVISPNGRWIAFRTLASDVSGREGDTRLTVDVVLLDRRTGEKKTVNRDETGAIVDTFRTFPTAVTNDGDVLFATLDPANPGLDRVILRLTDSQADPPVSVPISAGGQQGLFSSVVGSFSEDGRLLVYATVDGTRTSVLLFDRETGTARDVHVSSPGAEGVPTPGDRFAFSPQISADGARVVFASSSTNLTPEDPPDPTTFLQFLHVHEVATGQTRRLSDIPVAAGVLALTADGTAVIAQEVRRGGIPTRLYRFDIATGQETLLLQLPGAFDDFDFLSVSQDGRWAVFRSNDPLVAPDADRQDDDDVFLLDTVTGELRLVSQAVGGVAANEESRVPSISGGGRWIVFQSQATNLETVGDDPDGNRNEDVFLVENPLWLRPLTEQADRFTGGIYEDGVVARAGSDTLDGRGGDDDLNGGDDFDRIDGGAGDDSLFGQNDPDLVIGGPDADTVRGGQGDDTLFGGGETGGAPGDLGDLLLGEDGNDEMFGDAGRDTLRGGAGDDVAFGGEGDDSIDGGDGGDELSGDDTAAGGPGHGNDTILGGAGADAIEGGGGRDSLVGGDGDDAILGESDADILNGRAGSDNLSGGTGRDVISGDSGNDRIDGGAAGDLIGGDTGADTIDGGTGADTVEGGKESDRLLGGDQNDTLSGDSADSTGEPSDGRDTLRGGRGDDSLQGGGGNDSLAGEAGRDTLLGELGDDLLFGGTEGDVANGGRGRDELHGDDGADELFGAEDGDSLFGEDGADRLSGGAGVDLLSGGEGNDTLSGDDRSSRLRGDGADRLSGGAGADVLAGGLGADVLTGGLGRDRFLFRSLAERGDVIQDFARGLEDIDLRVMLAGLGVTGDPFATGVVSLRQSGADALLLIDRDGAAGPSGRLVLARLLNEDASAIGEGDFLV